MKRIQLEIGLIFVTSFVIRLMLFYPTFVQGGDLGQFSTFVREIHMAGGLVPSQNLLYFPGTEYIYPPFLFLMVNLINEMGHATFSPFASMREMLVVASIASAVTSSVIYGLSRSDKSATRNLISGILLVLFMPDIYALSWGGDPFIIGEMFFVLTLLFLSFRSERKIAWIIGSTVTLVLLALSHDLTWFFATFSVLVLLIYDIVKGNWKLLVRGLIPFLSGVAVGLLWWLPRIRFVYDAFFITESTGYGAYETFSSSTSYILVFVPFAISVVAIAVYSLYRSDIKLSKVVWDPFIIALVSSLIFIPFIVKSPTLGGRIMYFSIILGTIVVLRFFGKTSGPVLEMRGGRRSAPASKILLVVLLIIVLVAVPFQVINANGSVAHYKSGYYQYDSALLEWGAGNLTKGTVVAPNIGNYISSVDGVPVIIYGNFLVGGNQIEQRNAAISIVSDPSSQQSVAYLHQYNISYVVVSTEYLSSLGNSTFFPTSLYTQVYSDKFYVVEKFTG